MKGIVTIFVLGLAGVIAYLFYKKSKGSVPMPATPAPYAPKPQSTAGLLGSLTGIFGLGGSFYAPQQPAVIQQGVPVLPGIPVQQQTSYYQDQPTYTPTYSQIPTSQPTYYDSVLLQSIEDGAYAIDYSNTAPPAPQIQSVVPQAVATGYAQLADYQTPPAPSFDNVLLGISTGLSLIPAPSTSPKPQFKPPTANVLPVSYEPIAPFNPATLTDQDTDMVGWEYATN